MQPARAARKITGYGIAVAMAGEGHIRRLTVHGIVGADRALNREVALHTVVEPAPLHEQLHESGMRTGATLGPEPRAGAVIESIDRFG